MTHLSKSSTDVKLTTKALNKFNFPCFPAYSTPYAVCGFECLLLQLMTSLLNKSIIFWGKRPILPTAKGKLTDKYPDANVE